MKTGIHPFDKYPFDVKKLPSGIRRAVEDFDFYSTSSAIGKIIAQDNLGDSNSLLCWAYYVWIDAMEMQTGAEILSCGESALKIIAEILEKEPGHKPSLKLQKYINGEIKKVYKANKWYDKFHDTPIESLSLKEVEDFAYFLSDCANDGKFKEKEYRLWQRLYDEKPDTSLNERTGELYYGFKFYYLCRISNVLWRDLKKFEEARPLLWQVINWPSVKDAELYSYNISNAIQLLMLEAIEQNNAPEFVRLTELMISKFGEINQYRSELGKQALTLIIREEPAGKILQFALNNGNIDNIRSVIDHFFAGEVVFIRSAKIKENMQKARALAS
ncbi:hypothetical protein EGT74_18015 [Chitinophaga lutea]|uniref:Uncharacterized protein n=1 Tax=Chitinophaga lutea TaxID=2488634 RepID=A0A3N4QAY6_9BACT|nr:hypothetical protein [Chitinophaga lutea]RPE08914.1 hypothetical protein EGT74_18015 [Chitinophaga lutea]